MLFYNYSGTSRNTPGVFTSESLIDNVGYNKNPCWLLTKCDWRLERKPATREPIRQSGQKAFIDDLGWLTEFASECAPPHVCAYVCAVHVRKVLVITWDQFTSSASRRLDKNSWRVWWSIIHADRPTCHIWREGFRHLGLCSPSTAQGLENIQTLFFSWSVWGIPNETLSVEARVI